MFTSRKWRYQVASSSCLLNSEKCSAALLYKIGGTAEHQWFSDDPDCCRNKNLENCTNKAEGLWGEKCCFHLQALCVCLCCVTFVWTPSDQSGALILTLCVGGVASPTQNSLPRSTTQPTQVQRTSSSNWSNSQTADFNHFALKTRRKNSLHMCC